MFYVIDLNQNIQELLSFDSDTTNEEKTKTMNMYIIYKILFLFNM